MRTKRKNAILFVIVFYAQKFPKIRIIELQISGKIKSSETSTGTMRLVRAVLLDTLKLPPKENGTKISVVTLVIVFLVFAEILIRVTSFGHYWGSRAGVKHSWSCAHMHLSPSRETMKPYPFSGLKNFTLPTWRPSVILGSIFFF